LPERRRGRAQVRTTLMAASGFCFGSVNMPRNTFNERGQGSRFKWERFDIGLYLAKDWLRVKHGN